MSVCYVKVGPKGRAVFASTFIEKGSLVERSHVIRLRAADVHGRLIRYTFEWEPRNMHAIALGVGSLFNHAIEPNVSFQIDTKHERIDFRARRDIRAGEELTIHYTSEPGVNRPVGFKIQ